MFVSVASDVDLKRYEIFIKIVLPGNLTLKREHVFRCLVSPVGKIVAFR
jgi:hypothetical protein